MISCYSYKQPLLSKNQKSLEQFNEKTVFPYQATDQRRESILFYRQKVQVGMNGDEVLNIMGNPDEIDTLAFVGDPPRGWIWDYNIYKKFGRAPDDTDIYVSVYFDTKGKVKEVSAKSVE